MESEDLVCSTATYSTRGLSPKFKLPWFWRMIPDGLDEDMEAFTEEDAEYVAKCKMHRNLIFNH